MINLAGCVYEGSPRDIIVKMSEQIAEVLRQSHMPITGVGIVALMHVALCMVHAGVDDPTNCGNMPSFKTLLRVLTHGFSQDNWSAEELEEFEGEFARMVESLGGSKIPKGEKLGTPIMSPTLGVH